MTKDNWHWVSSYCFCQVLASLLCYSKSAPMKLLVSSRSSQWRISNGATWGPDPHGARAPRPRAPGGPQIMKNFCTRHNQLAARAPLFRISVSHVTITVDFLYWRRFRLDKLLRAFWRYTRWRPRHFGIRQSTIRYI